MFLVPQRRPRSTALHSGSAEHVAATYFYEGPGMKRILHVMGSLERSGMEMMLIKSNEEWRREGYECDVVATADAIGPIAAEMRQCGFRVFHTPIRSSRRYLPRLGAIRDFYKLCKSGYYAVHIHVESARPVFAVLSRIAGVQRIAITPHNTFRFRGLLRIRKLLERHFICLLGGRFGMISEGVKACEWDRFRIKGVRIWNWIDVDHFRPPSGEERNTAREALGIQRSDFVITTVGNCNVAKNHDAILRAVSLLPWETKAVYLHIGREQETYQERQLAAELQIENKVRFIGSVPDPRPYLWAADVFGMPSHYEGVGMAAVEAIASGVILVCSRVDGLLDVAAETQSTVLTSIDPDSIAEGLLTVAAWHPDERRSRGLRDSALVRNRFSVKNGVKSLIDGLYTGSSRSQFDRRESAATRK
jgi:glycosyltransferase involved in cell wall biosynthesis